MDRYRKFNPTDSGIAAETIANCMAEVLVRVLRNGYNSPITVVNEHGDDQDWLAEFLIEKLSVTNAQCYVDMMDKTLKQAHPRLRTESDVDVEFRHQRLAEGVGMMVLERMYIISDKDIEELLKENRLGNIR